MTENNKDLPAKRAALIGESRSSIPDKVSGISSDHRKSRERRQFLKKAALTSAPVILTVASRPAWGSPHFCTPSGWTSGASVPEEAWAECRTGYDADWWNTKNPTSEWPVNGHTTYFGPGNSGPGTQSPYIFDVGPNTRLDQIISANPNSPNYNAFYRAAVAAYLNALSDPMYNPTISQLQCIVRDILSTGHYVTTGGDWNPLEALDYLESTFML